MPQRVRVKLNLALIAENLSREDAKETSESEVISWLEDAGFTRDGEWWTVSEADLGQVDPTEVIEIDDSTPE